jgi:hypothetical protein
MPDAPLRAGVAVVSIDVPVGAPTGGYSRNKGLDDPGSPWADKFPSTRGVHTDATAKAVAMTNGVARAAIVRLDVCLVTPSLRTRIRRGLDAAGESAAFIVQATHTHGHVARFFEPVRIGNSKGFDVSGSGMDTYDPELETRIATAATKAILSAFGALTNVAVGSAVVDADALNADRRCENDPLYGPGFKNPKLTMIRFDEVDENREPTRPLVALMHYSVHGTVMAGSNPLLTTEISGAMELGASDALGIPVLFLQGSAGDVSPRSPALGFDGLQQLEWASHETAKLAKAAFEQAQPTQAPLAANLTSVERGVLLTREALGYERGSFPEHGAIGCQVGGKNCKEPFQTPVETAALLCAPLEPRPRLRTPMTLLQLQDIAMVTLPGEPTTAVGKKVEEALEPLQAKTALVLGYAQDHFGYLLEESDFLRGGYEPTVSPWGWRFGQYLVDEAKRLVETRSQPQEKPTDASPPEFTLRTPTDSVSMPGIVTQPTDVFRLETAKVTLALGDPSLGTPSVALERETMGEFVPVMASPTRAVINGPEILRRYEATPTFAEAPMATSRAHQWMASWETIPNTPLGRYRFVVTGQARVSGTQVSYRFETQPFSVRATQAISVLEARALSQGKWALSLRYPPNPIQFAKGDPVANVRVRDFGSSPEQGALARGNTVTVLATWNTGTSMSLDAPWDEALTAHVIAIPTLSGNVELAVEAGGFVDGLGNSNGMRLTTSVMQ